MTASRQSQAQATNPPPRYVLNDSEAIVMNQPQMVAEGRIVSAQWSPDGRYALAVRESQPVMAGGRVSEGWMVSVAVWRRDTRRVKELWHSPITLKNNLLQTMQIQWLPASSIATVTLITRDPVIGLDAQNGGTKQIVEVTQGLLWIDAARERVVEIPELLGDDVEISPTRPLAFLYHGSHLVQQGDDVRLVSDNTFQVIASNGSLGAACAMPPGLTIDKYWTQNGSMLAFRAMTRIEENQEPVFKWYARNAQTGEVTLLDAKPERTPAAPLRFPSLKVRHETAALRSGKAEAQTRPLWLDSGVAGEQQTTLLCADAETGLVSPFGDAVLYVTLEGAWVVPLTRKPKAAFMAELPAKRNN